MAFDDLKELQKGADLLSADEQVKLATYRLAKAKDRASGVVPNGEALMRFYGKIAFKGSLEVRAYRMLKLPDAIVAATAMSLNTPLVTSDVGFKTVSGLVAETFYFGPRTPIPRKLSLYLWSENATSAVVRPESWCAGTRQRILPNIVSAHRFGAPGRTNGNRKGH